MNRGAPRPARYERGWEVGSPKCLKDNHKSNGLQLKSDGLQPNSNGLQPKSDLNAWKTEELSEAARNSTLLLALWTCSWSCGHDFPAHTRTCSLNYLFNSKSRKDLSAIINDQSRIDQTGPHSIPNVSCSSSSETCCLGCPNQLCKDYA